MAFRDRCLQDFREISVNYNSNDVLETTTVQLFTMVLHNIHRLFSD